MPMSCEFTPETERQRIQHLVSDSSTHQAVQLPAPHWVREGLWQQHHQLSLKATVWPECHLALAKEGWG